MKLDQVLLLTDQLGLCPEGVHRRRAALATCSPFSQDKDSTHNMPEDLRQWDRDQGSPTQYSLKLAGLQEVALLDYLLLPLQPEDQEEAEAEVHLLNTSSHNPVQVPRGVHPPLITSPGCPSLQCQDRPPSPHQQWTVAGDHPHPTMTCQGRCQRLKAHPILAKGIPVATAVDLERLLQPWVGHLLHLELLPFLWWDLHPQLRPTGLQHLLVVEGPPALEGPLEGSLVEGRPVLWEAPLAGRLAGGQAGSGRSQALMILSTRPSSSPVAT